MNVCVLSDENFFRCRTVKHGKLFNIAFNLDYVFLLSTSTGTKNVTVIKQR